MFSCIYEKETFPRYAPGKLLDRGKNARTESYFRMVVQRAGVTGMIAFETCATSFRGYSYRLEYYFIDISRETANITVISRVKWNFLIKLEVIPG